MTEPSARARLDAYMAHESDADQAEFAARVDAVVAEAVAGERQQRQADHRTWQHDLRTLRTVRDEADAKESSLARVERLVEEARDKGNTSIDTYLLLDTLGLES